MYELRVPRLQIIRSKFEKQEELDNNANANAGPLGFIVEEGDRRALRREIMEFWQSLSEQMDTLEENFIQDHPEKSHLKSLPRLPSADDAYDSYDEDGLATPKGQPSNLPPLPPNTPLTPKAPVSARHVFPFPRRTSAQEATQDSTQDSVGTTLKSDSSSSLERSSLQLLASMRHTFQRTEQNLYAQLSRTSSVNLNDIRRSFESAGRGATMRLSAWEAKHASGSIITPETTVSREPEWWKPGCHAVPGSSIIVRESDWGSIIAFTLRSVLSSSYFHHEIE